MSGIPTSTRLPEADRHALDALAARRGEAPSDTLRALVRGAVSNPEAISQAAEAVAAAQAPARPARRRKPSGLQVSYRRAVAVLARALDDGEAAWWNEPRSAHEQAEAILRDALSDRQRARLDAEATPCS